MRIFILFLAGRPTASVIVVPGPSARRQRIAIGIVVGGCAIIQLLDDGAHIAGEGQVGNASDTPTMAAGGLRVAVVTFH